MKVKNRMSIDLVTATVDMTHHQAVSRLRDHGFRRLPVVDKKDQLVGIISERDLLKTAPSPDTPLSIYEMYTLMSQLTVGQIMTRPVYAVDEECDLGAAARFMVEKDIGCLPVVQAKHLVGIITETDIFKALVEALGSGIPGTQIVLNVPNQKGVLAHVAGAIAQVGGNIISVAVFGTDRPNRGEMTIKEHGADTADLQHALESLEDIEVISVRSSGQNKLLSIG